jgi:predicted nucleotide-binding protein
VLDAAAYELADRLYEPIRQHRDRQLADYVKSATAAAAAKGTLGAGFFHKELASRHVEELRQRSDSLLHILKQLGQSTNLRTDSDGRNQLAEYLDRTVRGDADSLSDRLNQLLQRFNGNASWYTAELKDEVPNVVSKVQAEMELFARQSSKSISDAGRLGVAEILPDSTRVFVVHGRNNALVADLFAFLKSVGLQPIAWRDAVRQTGKGAPYIGEILEMAFGTAQAIVVLLSPDDEVRLAPQFLREDDEAFERETHLQPRPNVLFEAGMAFGFRRDRTILVEVGSPKPFSDVAGRHTVRLSNDVGRREDLIERLRTAGCAVSYQTQAWQTVGNFEASHGSAAATKEIPTPIVKFVDLNYPHDSGMQARLEADGYKIRWSGDSSLARRLDIEGWSLAAIADEHGREMILKMKDRPEDQTLIKRKVVKT